MSNKEKYLSAFYELQTVNTRYVMTVYDGKGNELWWRVVDKPYKAKQFYKEWLNKETK